MARPQHGAALRAVTHAAAAAVGLTPPDGYVSGGAGGGAGGHVSGGAGGGAGGMYPAGMLASTMHAPVYSRVHAALATARARLVAAQQARAAAAAALERCALDVATAQAAFDALAHVAGPPPS